MKLRMIYSENGGFECEEGIPPKYYADYLERVKLYAESRKHSEKTIWFCTSIALNVIRLLVLRGVFDHKDIEIVIGGRTYLLNEYANNNEMWLDPEAKYLSMDLDVIEESVRIQIDMRKQKEKLRGRTAEEV